MTTMLTLLAGRRVSANDALSSARFIGAPGRRALIWEHRPARMNDLAVVVCPPLGYHATCADRSLRILAEDLAARGHLVVRVEYFGTGNAEGSWASPDLVAAWRASVDAALSRATAGGRRACLVGVGFGALVALQCAASVPAATHLVLWDPTVSGRRFARELSLLAMATSEPQPDASSDAVISVVGHRYSEATLDAMRRLDATRMELHDRKVLVVVRPEQEGADPLVDALRAGGNTVTARALPGTAEMIETDAELARVPRVILDEIESWVGAEAIARGDHGFEMELDESSATSMLRVTSGCEEEFTRIGPAGLAGFWGWNPTAAGRTCVIFLNNGVAPSTGPARAWVEYARALNERGVATLRLDTSGIGDSQPRRGRSASDTHARVVVDDVSDAIDAAQWRGFDRFLVLGLCSGAYNALEAQRADPRIESVFALNPALWVTPRRLTCWLAPWWRLFEFGMRKTPLRVRVLALPRACWWIIGSLRIAPPGDLTIRTLAKLRRDAVITFNDNDPGLVDLERRSLRRIDRYRRPWTTVQVDVGEPFDHSLFGFGARERVFERVVEWVERCARTERATGV